MRCTFGINVVLVVAFCAPLALAGTTVETFTITGAGISASGTIALMATGTPGVDEIVGITGSFSTTKRGGFSGAIIGPNPGSYDSSKPTTGAISGWDNLFYPSGSAPGLNGYPPGGTLDNYGLDFIVAGGYTVNVFSEGNAVLLSDGTSFYVDKDAPVSFAVSGQGPTLTGVVNSASFEPGIVAGSWITILGTSLSPKTDSWSNAIVDGKLPVSLDGVSVSIGGQPGYIAYVSPTQINAVAPDVGSGSVSLTVTVTNSGVTSTPVNTLAASVQPAFFQWGSYAVATHQDYSLAVENGMLPGLATTPAKPGEVIILWGTGFGPTSPSTPEGVEVPNGTIYNTANAVTVAVGDQTATVYGAALASGSAALYQVAIQIPASLANGDYPIVATVANASSPSNILITVHD